MIAAPEGYAPVVDLPVKRKRPTLVLSDTNALMNTMFDPIRWIVEDYLPEGFAVLAGRQKLGKTWMAIDFSIAVATGGLALGALGVDRGDALYIDLENGQRRIQRRIREIFPHDKSRPDLSRLTWATEAPALDKGLIDALDAWRRSVPDPRLVVIDVLQRIKPAGHAARNAYENDYSSWAPLQSWAMQHGIAVLGLHHVRKGGADDPLEALSGSNGLSAVADTTLVLDRTGEGLTLYARGRDVEVKESALTFTSGLWSLTGDAAKVRMTRERQSIIDALTQATEPMTPTEVADVTGMSNQNARQTLSRMARSGEISRAARGRYQLSLDPLSQPSHRHHEDEHDE